MRLAAPGFIFGLAMAGAVSLTRPSPRAATDETEAAPALADAAS